MIAKISIKIERLEIKSKGNFPEYRPKRWKLKMRKKRTENIGGQHPGGPTSNRLDFQREQRSQMKISQSWKDTSFQIEREPNGCKESHS